MFLLLALVYLIYSYFFISYCHNKNINIPLFYFVLPILTSTFLLYTMLPIQFLFLFLILISIVPFFIISIFQLCFRKFSLLHEMHHRYFYLFCIIIYFYLLILLSCQVERKPYENMFFSSSILILIFYFFALLLKGTIKDKRFITHSVSFSSLLLLIPLLLCSFILTSYINNMLEVIATVLILLFPVLFLCYFMMKEREEGGLISYCTHLILFPFFLIGFFDLLIMHQPIYVYHTPIIFPLLKIGLYSTTILLIPTMKKFSNKVIYDILASCILLLFGMFLLY